MRFAWGSSAGRSESRRNTPGIVRQGRYHPANVIGLNGMTRPQSYPISSQRLADQLQALSVLLESLTIRLLELEERLLAQEQRAQPGTDPESQQELEQRLEDTDQRLLRIEALLQDLEQPAATRHLQEVPRPVGQPLQRAEQLGKTEAEIFPEEGEQSFMDELIA